MHPIERPSTRPPGSYFSELMSSTRLDCHLFRGESAAKDGSSFIAVNPLLKPSQVVFAGSSAVRDSVASHVAYRLALDYFLVGVEHHYTSSAGTARALGDEDGVVSVLEEAFRSANTSVYGFGHKMAAGGRMAASLLGVVIEGGRLATGRVGYGSVYLFRNGQLFPFFESPQVGESKVGDAQEHPSEYESRMMAFIGSNAMVDVELASVELLPEDIVCVFSRPLTTLNETLLFEFLDNLQIDSRIASKNPDIAERLCADVFTEPETISFALVACVGPEAIFCSRVVEG